MFYFIFLFCSSRTDTVVCHCWKEKQIIPCEENEEVCRKKYNGICDVAQPGPDFERTGHWCNKYEDINIFCHLNHHVYSGREGVIAGRKLVMITRRFVGRSIKESAMSNSPGLTLRGLDTGGESDSLTLKFCPSRTEKCHCWTEKQGPCDQYAEKCRKEYRGICEKKQPGPQYEKTGYWCNR